MKPLSAQTTETLEWIATSDARLEVRGLPFRAETGGKWWRFPPRVEAEVPDYVFNTAKCSSGARLRLRTASPTVALRWRFHSGWTVHPNTSEFGAVGSDLYIDGNYYKTLMPSGKPTEFPADFEEVLYAGWERRERELTIYAPLFAEASLEAVGVEAGSKLLPAAPYAVEKPVVFYGTSITHGGCASQPSMSYEGQLCRRLNLDFVNFGLNGCGRGEAAVARLLSDVDASCYVLDFSQNQASVESLREAYLPFIRLLRARRPVTPILCVTTIYCTSELALKPEGNQYEGWRKVIREAVEKTRAEGDLNTHLVEGFELLGPGQTDGLTDGLHPNTLGFHSMATGLEPHLRRVLELPPATP